MNISNNAKVTMHFSLALDNGELIDSTFEREPAVFIIGDGNLPEGFENKMHGLQVGDERELSIEPVDGFGMPNPNNIQEFPHDRFSQDVELAEGLVINFTDAAGSALPGVVKSIQEDCVVVDFNHPLAGKKLVFTVQIINVEQVLYDKTKTSD